ncbi:MAG: hypothetical protein JRD94_12200 [Deltaproteobacteria bacterium]|nr:hypothetical protein [Deltaproteobacteria bacterium]
MKPVARFHSFMFLALLTPALLQTGDCGRGDTYLLSLELEVDGQNLVQGFNVNERSGYLVTTTASTATLTVQTRMADSDATYQWRVNGTSIEAGQIGVGGGSVVLDVPPGPSQLYIGVRAIEGNVHGYWVDVLGPIDRNTASVVLAGQQTQPVAGATFDIQFYRNTAYGCGLSGNYTLTATLPTRRPCGSTCTVAGSATTTTWASTWRSRTRPRTPTTMRRPSPISSTTRWCVTSSTTPTSRSTRR